MKIRAKMLRGLGLLLALLLLLCSFVGAEALLPWPISTEYGITTDYIYPDGSVHDGVDMAAPTGTPIYAQFDGTAEYYQVYTVIDGEKYLTSYGNFVYLTSADETRWVVYAHMDAFEGCELQIPSTQTRQRSGHDVKLKLAVRFVEAGDLLGYVGSTGNSTGPHLHYGLKLDDEYVDPTELLDENTCATRLKRFDRQAEFGDDFYAYLITGDTWENLTGEGETGVMARPLTGREQQIWHFVKQPDGSYEIANCATDRYLRVSEDGVNVCTGTTPRGWRIYGGVTGFQLKADGAQGLLGMVKQEASGDRTTQLQDYTGISSQYFHIWKLPYADTPILQQIGPM